jgi:dihydrofolate reductase
MHLRIIAAVDFNGAIGAKGGIPWRAPADMARVKRMTKGKFLLLGRKTYESLPKALEDRDLIVLTRSGNTKLVHGGEIVFDLGQVVVGYARRASEIYVGGGADVYRLTLPLASSMELTVVHTDAAEADTFFPPVDLSVWRLTAREDRAADKENPPLTYLSLARRQPDMAPNPGKSGPKECWKIALETLRTVES